MKTTELLNFLLLGGLLGVLGQGLRVIVGLKKIYQEAEKLKTLDSGLSTKEANSKVFDSKRILLSLLIGFTGGALATFTLDGTFFSEKSHALGIVAAGYSGTDFIEGLIGKYLKS